MDPLLIFEDVKKTYIAIKSLVDNINDELQVKNILLYLNQSKYKILIKLKDLKFINLESLRFSEDCFYLWNKIKEKNLFLVVDNLNK